MMIIRVVNNSELSNELNLGCHIVPVSVSSVLFIHFKLIFYAGASKAALVLII